MLIIHRHNSFVTDALVFLLQCGTLTYLSFHVLVDATYSQCLYLQICGNMKRLLFNIVALNTWWCVMIRTSCIIDEPTVKALQLTGSRTLVCLRWPPEKKLIEYFPPKTTCFVSRHCRVYSVASHLMYNLAKGLFGWTFSSVSVCTDD